VEETRKLQGALGGHPQGIRDILAHLQAEHLLTWAPKDAGQVQKISTTWRLHAAEFERLQSLSLLVPFIGLPGMRSAADIMDVWSHPLLQDKWKDLVSSVRFLMPPATLIMSGASAPLHAQRHIAIITIGGRGQGALPCLEQWQPTLCDVQEHATLIIDVAHEARWKVRKLLNKANLRGCLGIDPPRPSIASTTLDARAAIHCQFLKATLTYYDAEALRRYVASLVLPFGALAGWSDLLAADDAMLLEVASASAGVLYHDLCAGMLPITPRLLLVRTNAVSTVWQHSLTESWQSDPTMTGEKLRHRPSRGGQSVFAQVAATTAQLAAARARKGHAPLNANLLQPQTLQATIQIPLGTAGAFDDWLPRIMSAVSAAAGKMLTRAIADDGLQPGEWRPLFDMEGRWMNAILVQFDSEVALRAAHHAVHGKGVHINGFLAALEVESTFLDLGTAAAPPRRS
jgi:hypothetical protein